MSESPDPRRPTYHLSWIHGSDVVEPMPSIPTLTGNAIPFNLMTTGLTQDPTTGEITGFASGTYVTRLRVETSTQDLNSNPVTSVAVLDPEMPVIAHAPGDHFVSAVLEFWGRGPVVT